MFAVIVTYEYDHLVMYQGYDCRLDHIDPQSVAVMVPGNSAEWIAIAVRCTRDDKHNFKLISTEVHAVHAIFEEVAK